MKKKSLYDIAMERKNNQVNNNDNIIVVRKKSVLQTIFEIIGKIIKLIIYAILLILLTIGAILKNVF